MTRKPELVIGYDESYTPVAAVCSGCGQEMPAMTPADVTNTAEIIRGFAGQFALHVARKHPAGSVEPLDSPL